MKPTIHVIIVLMIILATLSAGLGSSESKVIVDVGEKTSIEIIAKTNNATIIANILKQILNVNKVKVEEIEPTMYSIRAIIPTHKITSIKLNLTPITLLLEKPIKVIIKSNKCFNLKVNPSSEFIVKDNELTIDIKVELNVYMVLLGLTINYLPPIIAIATTLYYVKRKTINVKDKGYYVASETLRRASIVAVMLIIMPAVVGLIASLILTDYPIGITYLTGIPLSILMILILISFLAMIFTPLIYTMKYTAPLFGEKEVRRRDYLYALLALIPVIAGLIIIFLIIAFMPSSIAEILSKLPIPLGTAIWFMLGLA